VAGYKFTGQTQGSLAADVQKRGGNGSYTHGNAGCQKRREHVPFKTDRVAGGNARGKTLAEEIDSRVDESRAGTLFNEAEQPAGGICLQAAESRAIRHAVKGYIFDHT